MWLKNLKSFTQHLYNSKLYTAVTVLGFTISLSFVILLSVYIKNELSVNDTQPNKDRIYRLINENYAGFAPPIGEWLQGEFPEIESFTRISTNGGILITTDDVKVKFNYLLADSTFFNIFNFDLIEGEKETALKTRNSVVLSREFANRIFGSDSPMHQLIKIDGVSCVVNGVVGDISQTSNFIAWDAIINFRALADFGHSPELLTSFGNSSFGLYFLAKPNTNLPAKAPEVLELFKKDFWLYQDGRTKTVSFEPLTDSYFSPISGSGIVQNNKTLILILFAIVILILVLAIINYINLTIAQSGMRVKEIAIKKLLGSSRSKLMTQLVVESIIISSVAMLLAILGGFLAEPLLNSALNTQIRLADVFTAGTVFILFVFIVAVGFFSGIIPAFIITRLRAVDVIKGGFRRKSKILYSKFLIAFQYTVVIVLVIATIIIAQQTAFMRNHDLGFNHDNIVWLVNNLKRGQTEGFRNVIEKIPGVKRVSFVKGSPIDGGNNQSFMYEDQPVSFQEFVVDSSFFEMMKINITPTSSAYSKQGIWLNQYTVDKLGLDPLPVSFKSNYGEEPVLGITNNFNIESLHKELGFLILRQLGKDEYPWSILVQLQSGDVIATFDQVKKSYLEYTGGMPFDSGFFDDDIQSWYDSEKRTAAIVSYFALLSIVISIMGIFAMAVFYNQQKIKEIGIRKVNGATVFEIVKMLNFDFVKWVAIAFVVACPIAYYAMNKWLQNFPYKTQIHWWVFVLAGIFALAVALITVSWQTWRAARRNPVEALRYE
ncbi:MAG TPA: FtsX-like permease family protein [Bacteroidales bacterium]|nr:FtsX-like permease family protein [Bacteroidales bacterium]